MSQSAQAEKIEKKTLFSRLIFTQVILHYIIQSSLHLTFLWHIESIPGELPATVSINN